jgi:uncharacterized membrane protein (DUF4010 family)
MTVTPSVAGFALLLGLSFFLGLAVEEVYTRAGERRPGGIRTFPILALGGGVLYLLDPERLLPFTGGLLVLGALLVAYYARRIAERDVEGKADVELIVPALNLLAYLLGAIALAAPPWVAIATTVAAVLLFTLREGLHALAQRVELREIVTAGQFLILTGIVLPLLPSEPVTTLTTITPRQAWLALVAVSTISYASYLVQRFLAPAEGEFGTAVLGGLYSSTATTVVLARQAKADPSMLQRARAGITLATSIMYLRVLAVVAVFNLALAGTLAPSLVALFALGAAIAAVQYRRAPPNAGAVRPAPSVRNPLELGAAALFAALFVIVSIASGWVAKAFGTTGIYILAAIVGVSDIDPFVLTLAQGGVAGMPLPTLGAAILIAAASNNVLKAGYAIAFAGWRASLPSVAALAFLAAASVAIAVLTGLR